MSNEPLDLSSLDPTADQLRQERLLRAIAQRAKPALAERARQQANNRDTVGRQLVRWQPHLIAASLALALPAVGATAWRTSATAVEAPEIASWSTSQIATALGVSAELLPYVEPEDVRR